MLFKLTLKPLLMLLLALPLLGQQEPLPDLDSSLAAAQQAQATNNYAGAVANYERAVQLRPDIPELRANLGLMQHEAGDLPSAIQSFQQALRLKPSLYVPTLFLGIDYVRTGRPKEAIPLLLKAKKIRTTDPLPSLTLGRAYIAVGEYRSAIVELRRAIHLDPKQSSAWFDLGIAQLDEVEREARAMSETGADTSYAKALYAESLVKQERFKEAAEVYNAVLAAKDQPPCMLAEAGFLSLKQGYVDNAERQFTAEETRHPECLLAVLGEARLKIDTGASQEALNLVEQVWTADHGSLTVGTPLLFEGIPSGHLQGFLNYLAQQQLLRTIPPELYAALTEPRQEVSSSDEASAGQKGAKLQSVQAAVLTQGRQEYTAGHHGRCTNLLKHSLDSGSTLALESLSACSFFTGDYALTSDAGRALQRLPSRFRAEALFWSISANEKLAYESFARFQQLEPSSAKSHVLLGDIYRQREQYDDAQKEYGKALDIAPNDTAGLLGSAAAYYGDANFDKTVEIAQKALLHSPNDPEINLLLGEALMSQHKFTDAESFLLKGLNAKPQMLPHVHALLGEAYAGEGKTQDAIRELKMGTESDQDGSIHYRLARLYTKVGDNADAAAEIQQMKALQQRRREGAVIAVQDSHPSNLDDEP